MHLYPTDLAPAIVAVAVALILLSAAYQLVLRHQSPQARLRLLTGTHPQRAALRLALAPVMREFVPLLERAGQEIRAIVLVPTLVSGDGQPLAAEVEQHGESSAFVVRLAHRVGSTLRPPDDVAGTLAENLLYLYRQAADAVTVVHQTPAAISAPPPTNPIARNGLAAVSRHVAQNEAEETVVDFKPSPLGQRNGQGS